MKRSTEISPPLQLVFPALIYHTKYFRTTKVNEGNMAFLTGQLDGWLWLVVSLSPLFALKGL